MALKYWLGVLATATVFAVASVVYMSFHQAHVFEDQSTIVLHVNDTPITAEVVSTEKSREQGLSGRKSLAPGTGMLFAFESDGSWGIWMKDMLFDIDIVWLSADGVVLTVVSDVTPESYPRVFSPAAPARYVVELPASFAATHGVAEGTKIVVQ